MLHLYQTSYDRLRKRIGNNKIVSLCYFMGSMAFRRLMSHYDICPTFLAPYGCLV